MAGVMIVAAAATVWLGARHFSQPEQVAPAAAREKPWLGRDAAAQIITSDGELGPLFEGSTVGGSAPSAATRDRIAKFARDNHVTIDLDITDDTLVSVRFDVTFGGCCGYEGADTLTLRLQRPKTSECGCGCPTGWVDDWEISTPSGAYVLARVRVNRVIVRWESKLTLAEVLARADHLLGADAATIAKTAGYHWVELAPHHRYRLELPYILEAGEKWRQYSPRALPRTFAIDAIVSSGKITELAVEIGRYSFANLSELEPTLESHWGRSVAREQGEQILSVWSRPDREITANFERGQSSPALTIVERTR